MASKSRKRFCILFGILLVLSYGCMGLQKKPDRIAELEKRMEALETLMGAGVGSSFFPARSVSGDAAGDADKIAALDQGSGNSDALFLTTDDNETTADYDWMFAPYKADDDDVLCTAEDLPWCIDTASANVYWTMLNVYGRKIFGGMPVSDQTDPTITVYGYQTGTFFINDDDDVIEFDLPVSGPHGTNDITDLVFCFGNSEVSDSVITIDPGASDKILLDGVLDAVGDAIVSSGTASQFGDHVCLVGITEETWKVTGYSGTWTAQ